MRSSNRRQDLLRRVRESGYVDAVALARDFGVDGSTIRRDLAQLTRAGLIRRTHGGVLPAEPEAAIDVPYKVRAQQNAVAKATIARAAADLVRDGQTVILDNGSTTYQIAVELRRRNHLTIITNDLRIGIKSGEHPTNSLHMSGGLMLNAVYTLVGPAAVAAFEDIHADWAFLGAEGIDAAAGISNINVVELPVKHAMMAAAARTVFVADSSKIGRRAFATVCRLTDADLVISDAGVPQDLRAAFGDKLRCV